MLDLKEQNKLNFLSDYKGMSLRGIADETGHHFNTVKKYVNKEDWNEEYKPRKERKSLLWPLYGVIDEWLKEDMKRKKKYRRTATKIYNDLKNSEEYGELLLVGRQTVMNYVNKRKKALYKDDSAAAIYGLHAMCEAQVDFGWIPVITKSGAEEEWHELVVSFPWSNAGFVQICQFETKECLIEGLQRIFEFIGGVPTRILFDNMSSAVVHIEAHGERKLTDMFGRFRLHHRFRADFCNPNSGNEKGNVEAKVGYLRRNFLLPPRKVDNLEELNKGLLEECMLDLRREHYRKGEEILDLFSQEQDGLIPLPKERFKVFELKKMGTDNYSFIEYEGNFYSTSAEYKDCEVWVEIGTSEIRILNENYQQIASHIRSYEKKPEPIIDFANYIETLCKRPRGFMSSPYLLTLPETVQNHLKKLAYKDLQETLLILLPILKDEKFDDLEAVLQLTEIKNADDLSMAFRALTENSAEQSPVTTPLTPPQTPCNTEISAYNALLGGEKND